MLYQSDQKVNYIENAKDFIFKSKKSELYQFLIAKKSKKKYIKYIATFKNKKNRAVLFFSN